MKSDPGPPRSSSRAGDCCRCRSRRRSPRRPRRRHRQLIGFVSDAVDQQQVVRGARDQRDAASCSPRGSSPPCDQAERARRLRRSNSSPALKKTTVRRTAPALVVGADRGGAVNVDAHHAVVAVRPCWRRTQGRRPQAGDCRCRSARERASARATLPPRGATQRRRCFGGLFARAVNVNELPHAVAARDPHDQRARRGAAAGRAPACRGSARPPAGRPARAAA